jgi:hypothetical protein
MGWGGMGWDGMGWEGMGRYGMVWEGMGGYGRVCMGGYGRVWEAELPAEPPAELPVSSPRFGRFVNFVNSSPTLTPLTARAAALLEMLGDDASSGSLRLLGLEPTPAATARSTQ